MFGGLNKVSIDSYLKQLSYSYYLKKEASETTRISTSVDNLQSNLRAEFPNLMNRSFIFGSYDRDTILPRSIDSKSDVDVMVVFNHTEYERTPETYRAWLKNFADKYYKNRYGSEVLKSFPTVVIKLQNIHFDLVPAKDENNILYHSLYIPDKTSGWQETNPKDVKQKLIDSNTRNNSIVKPIVRLLKAWNCTNGYPFDAYELEMKIANIWFAGNNVQDGLFEAVDNLGFTLFMSEFRKNKVESLKYNLGKVKEQLNANDEIRAKNWLHRVFPQA